MPRHDTEPSFKFFRAKPFQRPGLFPEQTKTVLSFWGKLWMTLTRYLFSKQTIQNNEVPQNRAECWVHIEVPNCRKVVKLYRDVDKIVFDN